MRQPILIFTLLSLLFFQACKTQKDPTQILAEQKEAEVLYNNTIDAIKRRDFVLEADRLFFKNGKSAYVDYRTNFVALSGETATIQIASNNNLGAGLNGLGGVTITGTASHITESVDKNGDYRFKMRVTGTNIFADVYFTLPKGTNRCTITVSHNLHSMKLRLSGNIYPTENSDIFEGRSL